MNAVFIAVVLISSVAICFISPSEFLPALLTGNMNAAKCALTLFCVYAAWMGLSAVAEECALTQKAGRLLKPVCRKLFKTEHDEAAKNISMNLSCNLLGIGGAATPYGVKAMEALEREGNTRAQNLLFIINGTSIQLIPATVIALRAAQGSVAAHDITLPTLIATFTSTAIAVAAYLIIDR